MRFKIFALNLAHLFALCGYIVFGFWLLEPEVPTVLHLVVSISLILFIAALSRLSCNLDADAEVDRNATLIFHVLILFMIYPFGLLLLVAIQSPLPLFLFIATGVLMFYGWKSGLKSDTGREKSDLASKQ